MIAEYLLIGRENAKTARELARLLHCDPRDISQGVERDRRNGQPICASCDPEAPGYYLADNAEDIQNYCKSLHKRAGEIYKTRRALLATAEKMAAENPQEA